MSKKAAYSPPASSPTKAPQNSPNVANQEKLAIDIQEEEEDEEIRNCQNNVADKLFRATLKHFYTKYEIIQAPIPEPKNDAREAEDQIVIKNVREMEIEEFNNFDVISIKGSCLLLKKKSNVEILVAPKKSVTEIDKATAQKGKEKAKTDKATAKKGKKNEKTDEATAKKATSQKGKENEKTGKAAAQKGKENEKTDKVTAQKDKEIEKCVSTTSKTSSKTEELKKVKIEMKNGNSYEGEISRRLMHGLGKYNWSDGTVYEGQFKDGYPTGRGKMILPDLTRYEGEVYKGLFHGEGVLFLSSTPKIYCGQWRYGNLHGKGWLYYNRNNWYDGEWSENKRSGFGTRHYLDGTEYEGHWCCNNRNGEGAMIWTNNDYYKGKWIKGTIHGYGEYIWKAFFNKTFTFPIQNTYKGEWCEGVRTGLGIMNFGTKSGAKIAGFWKNNEKHGPGVMDCGNGRFIEGKLFENDKPKGPIYASNTVAFQNISKYVCSKYENDIESINSYNNFEIQPNWEHLVMLPIFTIPELVDLNYYINKIIIKLQEIFNNNKKNINDNTGLFDKTSEIWVRNFEEKSIKDVIIQYLPKLTQLYQKYSSITAEDDIDFETVMIKMFLWQFYKDIGVVEKGLPLVDIDLNLTQNPYSGIIQEHDPFEKIYFWQFLMSLVDTSIHVMENFIKANHSTLQLGRVLATIFNFFLNEAVFNGDIVHKGLALFQCKNLLPFQKVYEFYKELGEPLSVKTLFRETCLKKGDELPCYSICFRKCGECYAIDGINSVSMGDNIAYLHNPLSTDIGVKFNDEVLPTESNNLLTIFHKLKPKRVFKCLAAACPLIMSDGLICNVDYQMVFIEFYETMLNCAALLAKKELRKREILRLRELERLRAEGAEEEEEEERDLGIPFETLNKVTPIRKFAY